MRRKKDGKLLARRLTGFLELYRSNNTFPGIFYLYFRSMQIKDCLYNV